jgi:2Fe-2S ferredoxin
MPKIYLPQLGKEIFASTGANLMQTLLGAGVPVASSCKGEGVCGKCRLSVKPLSGDSHSFGPDSDFLREKFQLNGNFQISCKLNIVFDLEVRATYW